MYVGGEDDHAVKEQVQTKFNENQEQTTKFTKKPNYKRTLTDNNVTALYPSPF